MKKKPVRIFNRFVKRDDCRIYVIGYKPCPMPDNALMTPIEAGAALHDTHFTGIRDDMGDNISKLNPVYCDLTATYWINKNHPTTLKYLGQCQYSKLLPFKQDRDFDKIFKDYNCIAAKPLSCKELVGGFVRNQFIYWHGEKTIEIVQHIIYEKFPEYADAWDTYVNNGYLIFAGAGYVLKTEDYHEWCRFCFGVCDELFKAYGGSVEAVHAEIHRQINSGEFEDRLQGGREVFYQGLVMGFVAERLFTAFVQKLGKIYFVDYDYREHIY